MALLSRRELCKLMEFDSWADLKVWLSDVIGAAYRELKRDFLRDYDRRGEQVPPGSEHIKYGLVRRYPELEAKVEKRVRELEDGVTDRVVNKSTWKNCHHYQHFVVRAIALDRLSARNNPEKNHIATRQWARDPVKLVAIMYDLTNTICHD
ncbi:hypothetical protein C8A05DRAFT_15366 [Staphylotrichum tortipilum]|uniref:Uncharacterized protein n=1 Tax=Staphylotrichum tortipilum TaxID=2831512 RepID=A0AAN6ML37_9PEZI|nr:hypothetical protein C8A05DRAFT_15366 [Staphylotrichum longicolle]